MGIGLTSDFIVAVHALVYLQHKGCIASSEELAKNICTNPARVRKIMAKLKALGVVTTREGHVGGYCPAPDLGQVSLEKVASGLAVQFVETSWHSGSREAACLVSSGMSDAMATIYGTMNQACMTSLRKITINTIEKELFAGK